MGDNYQTNRTNVLKIQGKIKEVQGKEKGVYKLARKLFPNKWNGMDFMEKRAVFNFCQEHQEDIKSWLKEEK